MGKGRLEAFSDGVLAIIITIMVLELRVPEGATLAALKPLLPVFASYALSFVYIGIYWNNHHHLLHAAHVVGGGMLWANLHLLFWLSLMPFATSWMGENHFATIPMAVYGVLLLMCAIAFTILVRVIVNTEGPGSIVARAIGSDRKGNVSLLFYVLGTGAAFLNRAISGAFYVAVALIWLIPDKRIERLITGPGHKP